MSDKCPRFSVLFAKALQRSAAQRGLFAYIPYKLMAFFGLAIWIVWAFSPWQPKDLSSSNLLAIYAAFITAVGFLGALSIYGMSHVMSVCLRYPFSMFLQGEDLFDEFIFWPQYILLVQFLCMLCHVLSICISLLTDRYNDYVLASNVSFFLYTLLLTWNLIDLMRQVSWHFADFEKQLNE